MPHSRTSTRLPAVVWPMMFGNVVIGTGVMAVTGLLDTIRLDLSVSIRTAGQLISWAALLVCVGAPILAALAGRIDRKRLLVGSMLWYAVLHALTALAPDFDQLLLWRVLAMAAAAVFTPQAAACIGQLVPQAQRGRAITFVFLGWSVASVIGNPLGAWIGGTLGWRWTMGLMAMLSLLSALWLARRMPARVVPPALSASAWRGTLGSSALLLTLSITVVAAAGQFVVFSYMAPYLAQRFGASTQQLSLLFLVYGLCGFSGNALLSHRIDRVGAERAMALALGLIASGMGLIWFAPDFKWFLLAILPWGLGAFASNSAQQARLVHLAPPLASASIALNTSAMYAGQALGAWSGGWLIEHGQMGILPLAGGIGLLGALGVSHWAHTHALRHPVRQPV
jgi:predicted MFS family arabinose efflux permease